MSSNLIINGSEYCKTQNVITNYTDFLSSEIDSFLRELESVKQIGIKDKKIDARITELQKSFEKLPREIEYIGKNTSSLLSSFQQNLNDNDTFTYSSGLSEKIGAIFSVFF